MELPEVAATLNKLEHELAHEVALALHKLASEIIFRKINGTLTPTRRAKRKSRPGLPPSRGLDLN
jgi:hypothetical protein